jgi:hypothetical protein
VEAYVHLRMARTPNTAARMARQRMIHAKRQRRAHLRSAIRIARMSVARSRADLVSLHSAGSVRLLKRIKEPMSQKRGNTARDDIS